MDVTTYLKQEKPSYQEGLNLLKKHKPNAAIIYMLNFGISKTNWKLLRIELEKVEQALIEKTAAKEAQQKVIKSDEDVYQLIKNINKNEFSKTYNTFLVQLHSNDIDIRYQAAKRIIESFEKTIIPTQKDMKYYNENGKLPDEHFLSKAQELPQTPVELMRRKLNLRTYISKLKKDPNKSAELQAAQIELKQIIHQEHALQH